MTSSGAGVALVAAATVASGVATLRALEGQRSSTIAVRFGRLEPDPGPPQWFTTILASSGLDARPERAWRATVRVGVVASLLLAWRWPQLVVACAVSSAVAMRVRRRAAAKSERRGYDTALIAVIDRLVSLIATGSSLAVALGEAADHQSMVGGDLALVVRRHQHGQALQAAIDDWAMERGTPGVRLLADALAIAGRSGGSQRGALLGVQATLRDREALGREVRALSSQARTSGVVLAVTPAAFAGVVAVVDSRVAAFFSTPAGWACLVGGIVLDGLGALWMHRLTEAHT